MKNMYNKKKVIYLPLQMQSLSVVKRDIIQYYHYAEGENTALCLDGAVNCV